MIYSSVGILLLGFWLISTALTKNENNKFFLLVSFIILVLMMGLRGDFTIDYRNNYNVFNYYGSISFFRIFSSSTELIFKLTIYILKQLLNFSNLQVHFVLSVLVCMPIFIAIRNTSRNYLLSVFFFFALTYYFEAFNITRNGISISFILLGFQYIQKRNLFRWLLCVIVAAGFHTSAILLFPLYFIQKIKVNIWNVIIAIMLGVLLILFYKNVLGILQKMLGFYSNYTSDSYGMWARAFSLGTSVFFLLRMLIYFSYFLIIIMNRRSVDYSVYFVLLSLVVFLLSYKIFMIYRFDLYLSGFLILIYPNAFSNSSLTKTEKQIISFIIIGLSIVWVSYSYGGVYYPFWKNVFV